VRIDAEWGNYFVEIPRLTSLTILDDGPNFCVHKCRERSSSKHKKASNFETKQLVLYITCIRKCALVRMQCA